MNKWWQIEKNYEKYIRMMKNREKMMKHREKIWNIDNKWWKIEGKKIVCSLLFFVFLYVSLFFIAVHCFFSIFHHFSLFFHCSFIVFSMFFSIVLKFWGGCSRQNAVSRYWICLLHLVARHKLWKWNCMFFCFFQHYIIYIWLTSSYMSFSRQEVPFNLVPSFRKNWHRFFLSLPGWADVFQTSVSITGPRKHRRSWKWHLAPQKRVIWLQRREGYFRPSLGTN